MRKSAKKETFLHRLSPQWLIALSFLAVILAGAFLLSLPRASATGIPLDPLTALFTSTSATCVTGLSVIDIGARLTLFGQIVVLALIQIGGLGIMTWSTFLLVLVGRRLSVQNEFALMNAYGVEEVKGIRSLTLWAIAFTLLFEGIGILILWPRYLNLCPESGLQPMEAGQALYYATFHAISAFCNAGFSLHPNSLIPFQRDPIYLGAINLLIVSGGLGFLVLYNLMAIKFWQRNLKTRGRVTLHTRIVVAVTLFLIAIGVLAFAVQEWNHTLADLPLLHKLSCSLFQSITPRTAGFNVVPMDQICEGARFTTGLLMAIGGSPGSAAGGIKTTTLLILVVTIVALCRNRSETVIFSRTIPHAVVREAIAIFLLAIFMILTAYGILLWTEAPLQPGDASWLMFETISASATVGLSVGDTASLSAAGRWVIIVCMFVGRLGPLAVALLIGSRVVKNRIRYPEEEVVVG